MKTYKLTINNQKYDARIVEYTPTHAKINVNGTDYWVQIEDDALHNIPKLSAQDRAVPMAPTMKSGVDVNSGEVRAPIPGVIVSIPVAEGDKVKKGQTIMILEAMKMQSEIGAPFDATIGKIMVKERSPIQEGDLMMTLVDMEVKLPTPPKANNKSQSEIPSGSGDRTLKAPIPGTIMEVKVSEGSVVKDGDIVLTLEAMKMESDIHSTFSGRVSKVHVHKGDIVQEGDTLIEFEDLA